MRRALVAATLVAGLALTTPASAGEPTDTLRRLIEQANQILSASDVTDDTRLTALRALVRNVFDAGEAAPLALGREWAVEYRLNRRDHGWAVVDVMVATGGHRSDLLARVLVGPFTTRASAFSILKTLVASGSPAFIAVE